jgi:lysophospholipase L1-like esterase
MEKERILFVGSSIIEQWNTCVEFPESINLGISGQTTKEFITKKIEKVANTKEIHNIVVYIGSNDIGKNRNPTEIIQNTIEILIKLQKNFPKIKRIIYVAIMKSPSRTEIQKKKIEKVNMKMREFSQKNEIIYCNVNRELSSLENYLADQTHLSNLGYSVLNNKIKRLINEYPTHF